ncbi:very-long-chain aldehyde decarbonylase CER1-like [Lycium ferocissimum]|uniref:very-long-chain aldehyde decarbonylase CER1-like n=1 Tax=Lycium ferocissimum TaxID=112874 RepID=UPI002814E14A|nr:very-long-chain aldehyde decarbonylase CER1-like [Lycium ferocissimum]
MEQVHHWPLWRTDGIIITALIHIGPVEFLYYWFHRALHHHFLYSRYHSHHHSSIVTEPITSVVHPFAEVLVYYALFTIPAIATEFTGTTSISSFVAYTTFIDFMNNMGHCNFELIPKWIFSMFPPLKYHSLHHTQFRTNYSLFMPMYDYIFGTMDKSSDKLYEKSVERKAEVPDVYSSPWQRERINNLIEEAIMEADQKGVKVLSLGLLNQEEKLNDNGEVYIRKHSQLKVKVVDGSSLVVAVILNSIPKGTSQVILQGRRRLSKVAYSVALALCQRGIRTRKLYTRLKAKFTPEAATNLVLSKSANASKTWLVDDGLSEDEQLKAPKGTLFIPYSQFPPRKARNDCFYLNTPAMISPKHLQNVDSCENWLPRRVMSAWRIAGILHAFEGLKEHECGNMMFDIDKVWKASLDHGFSPLTMASVTESKT